VPSDFCGTEVGALHAFRCAFYKEKIYYAASDSDDDNRNCDMVLLEQPRRNVGLSIRLDAPDTTIQTTSFSDDVQARSTRSRLRSMNAATVASVKDGRVTQVAPFLTDATNWKDIMLVRHMLADKPFDCAHGKSTAAWKTTAHYLSKAVDPDNNSAFPTGINGRQLKSRFIELMDFMRKLESRVPLNSGCDDEDISGELQLGLEDLLEMYSAVAANTAMANTSVAESRAKDKEKAETLRKASLGLLSVEELRNLRGGKRKATTNCVSPMPVPDMMAFKKSMASKEMHRKERLALKAKQLQMKEVEQERAPFRLQEQQLKHQADTRRFFQSQLSRNNAVSSQTTSKAAVAKNRYRCPFY
jgi:hypothetical protein